MKKHEPRNTVSLVSCRSLLKARAEAAAIKRAEAADQLRELDEKRDELRNKIQTQMKTSSQLREEANKNYAN